MRTEFFRKRILSVVGVATTFFIVIGIYVYTRYLNNATVEAVSQNYYFLVSDSTHIEASTHKIVLSGGAGYLLEENGTEYVTISAYPSKAEAESVQSRVNESTKILSVGQKALYFKTRKEKKNAKVVVNALSCLNDTIEIIHQEISRLEEGATQESSKRLLNIIRKQLDYLANEYRDDYTQYAQVCVWASGFIGEMIAKVVYAQDMRYLECGLCVAYHELAQEFSL